jgi:hypothetical protein
MQQIGRGEITPATGTISTASPPPIAAASEESSSLPHIGRAVAPREKEQRWLRASDHAEGRAESAFTSG